MIGRYLRAGIMEGGAAPPRREGTRWARFVRYADDFQVYVESKRAGGRVMASSRKERRITAMLAMLFSNACVSPGQPLPPSLFRHPPLDLFEPVEHDDRLATHGGPLWPPEYEEGLSVARYVIHR